MKQPPNVVQAYRVCAEFQRLLAENLDFDRAFEATFTKDPTRRRAIAIGDGELDGPALTQLDTDTLVESYKNAAQLFILMLPLMSTGIEKSELFPPAIETIFERKPPTDPKDFHAFAAQLKRDVADFRAHVDKLAAGNPDVAKSIREYKQHLLKPLPPPNRIVKPMTGYSKGNVLPVDEQYYQIDDCAVIREGAEMKLIGYIFIRMRF